MIRQARVDDAEAVLPLAADLATSFEMDPEAFRHSFQKCVTDEGALVLVAEEHSQILGYLLGSDHYTFFANGRVAAVEEVYVAPSHRKRGLGTELMRGFEKWAQARGSAQVTVGTRRASAFYSALGYEDTATCFRTILKKVPEQQEQPDK